jgi:hypothetical protein
MLPDTGERYVSTPPLCGYARRHGGGQAKDLPLDAQVPDKARRLDALAVSGLMSNCSLEHPSDGRGEFYEKHALVRQRPFEDCAFSGIDEAPMSAIGRYCCKTRSRTRLAQ